jgi:hypothetical protein
MKINWSVDAEKIQQIYETEFKLIRPKFEPSTNLDSIILPVVLYGCGTWSLTLREEHRLRVFENRVLRRIFGPKRDEVTGEWRKLHDEEDEMGGPCSTNWGEEENL